jgi:hypothetical protein
MNRVTLRYIMLRSSGGGKPKRARALSCGYPYPVPAYLVVRESGRPTGGQGGGGSREQNGRARVDDPTHSQHMHKIVIINRLIYSH